MRAEGLTRDDILKRHEMIETMKDIAEESLGPQNQYGGRTGPGVGVVFSGRNF